MNRKQLAEHLRFAAELGVRGTSRDPAWRARSKNGVGRGFSAAETRLSDAETSAGLSSRAGNRFARNGVGRGFSASQLGADEGVAAAGPEVPLAEKPLPTPIFRSPAEALDAIRADVGEDCARCKLHTLGRKQIVFGVGNPEADLMFVGEAPGADEDEQGIPFVGRAGQLLTKIIEAIGLKRDDVYIANVIKCRPPGNRNPEPDEVDTCQPFLFQQIDTIRPKVIVALGKFAAQALLQTDAPISKLRGRVYDYRGAKLIPTFHPAYLLRNPSSKREVWEDMKVVRSLLSP